jgi:hypothetical protein
MAKPDPGLPEWLLTLILVGVAVGVTIGSLFYIRDWLPPGNYPVIVFIPVAFVGIVCGGLVTLIVNAVYKAITSR